MRAFVRVGLFTLGVAGAAASRPAHAATEDGAPQAAFARAVESLERGAHDEAVDRFEALADQGFVHPDASYDRAVAYVRRARSTNAAPGDLGRAAAAFEETLLLRGDDDDAERALERVRGEIARRRAREGAEPIVTRASFGRALTALLPEPAWALLTLAGSLLATVGLALRRLASARRIHLAGSTAAGIGLGLLLLCGAVAFAARHYRTASQPAVVVVQDARFVDEQGAALERKKGSDDPIAIPEGTLVHVRERRGQLARVEWGWSEGWVGASQLRLLATGE